MMGRLVFIPTTKHTAKTAYICVKVERGILLTMIFH